MKKKSWKSIPEGGLIVNAGNSLDFKTGDWKASKPIHDKKKCISCLKCFILCPDNAIKVKDGKISKFDLDYCKGCGICANQCPVKAIEMKKVNE